MSGDLRVLVWLIAGAATAPGAAAQRVDSAARTRATGALDRQWVQVKLETGR